MKDSFRSNPHLAAFTVHRKPAKIYQPQSRLLSFIGCHYDHPALRTDGALMSDEHVPDLTPHWDWLMASSSIAQNLMPVPELAPI